VLTAVVRNCASDDVSLGCARTSTRDDGEWVRLRVETAPGMNVESWD
jgi:hypothetical protein